MIILNGSEKAPAYRVHPILHIYVDRYAIGILWLYVMFIIIRKLKSAIGAVNSNVVYSN